MQWIFLFRSGLPPLASNFELNKILKSPSKIMRLFWPTSKFFNRLWSSCKIFTYSDLVLPLYRFTRIYWSASIVISRIKILPTFAIVRRTSENSTIGYKIDFISNKYNAEKKCTSNLQVKYIFSIFLWVCRCAYSFFLIKYSVFVTWEN